ncbi:MAG: hypothetical protein HYY76_20245 [Acidobacteria bacterium]|nr:hypothetical protein [Acidobacteriota bacterium]
MARFAPKSAAARLSHRREPRFQLTSVTTMLRLNEAQRAVLIQAFPAIAHVAAGGLVFGQFLREPPFSIGLALGGVAIWVGFVSGAVALAGRK